MLNSKYSDEQLYSMQERRLYPKSARQQSKIQYQDFARDDFLTKQCKIDYSVKNPLYAETGLAWEKGNPNISGEQRWEQFKERIVGHTDYSRNKPAELYKKSQVYKRPDYERDNPKSQSEITFRDSFDTPIYGGIADKYKNKSRFAKFF